MVVVATGGLDACSTEFLAKVGDGNLNLGKVLKVNEVLCVGVSEVSGKCTIGCSERYDKVRSLAVAIARLAIALTVSF